jgi:hypothetical protein
MAIYEILIVGAASIRDYAMIAKKRLFFAAESRSHQQLMQFDDLATRLIELSHERRLVWPRASSLIEKETLALASFLLGIN